MITGRAIGAGVADTAEICTKDDDDSYYWRDIYSKEVVAVGIDLEDAMINSVADGVYYFPIGAELDGFQLIDAELKSYTSGGTSGVLEIDLVKCTSGAAICTTEAAMLDAPTGTLEIDATEWSSATAAQQVSVLDTAAAIVAEEDFIRVDVDTVPSGGHFTDTAIIFTFISPAI